MTEREADRLVRRAHRLGIRARKNRVYTWTPGWGRRVRIWGLETHVHGWPRVQINYLDALRALEEQ